MEHNRHFLVPHQCIPAVHNRQDATTSYFIMYQRRKKFDERKGIQHIMALDVYDIRFSDIIFGG